MQFKEQKSEALDTTVTGLESKLDELEQYTRIDSKIFSGLYVCVASYAQAAGGTDEGGGANE